MLKKIGINEINSPACEQAFKWITCHKNLKTMNEARFKFFLLYMIDNHNLHIEGKMNTSNPLDEKWGPSSQELVLKSNISTVDILKGLEELTIDMKTAEKEVERNETVRLEECFTEEPVGILNCNFCPGKYKREGHMKNHIETKHNMSVELICKCGQIFIETTRYLGHKKSCVK